MDNMNGNYFYANWKQREIVNKGIIPVRKFKVVTLFFINLGLILFHWEIRQISVSWYITQNILLQIENSVII